MSPCREFADGAQNVKNLVTSGYVDPETLYYHLQADWVEVVGRFGEEYEYRFSSPGTMQDLGRLLYSTNRMLREGKRRGGRLLNTYSRLKTDEGTSMWLKALAGAPHVDPVEHRDRRLEVTSDLLQVVQAGKWFSVDGLGLITVLLSYSG